MINNTLSQSIIFSGRANFIYPTSIIQGCTSLCIKLQELSDAFDKGTYRHVHTLTHCVSVIRGRVYATLTHIRRDQALTSLCMLKSRGGGGGGGGGGGRPSSATACFVHFVVTF